ncbi:unnamed protein product, partial [Sphenostylis stenocarpa]
MKVKKVEELVLHFSTSDIVVALVEAYKVCLDQQNSEMVVVVSPPFVPTSRDISNVYASGREKM